MSKENFKPDLITNWPVSLEEYENLNLADNFDVKNGRGGPVVHKKKDWRGIPRINFCRTRSAGNCALCVNKNRKDKCESPLN